MLYKGFKQDVIAMLGEFAGTTMFLFLGLGCIKTAQDSVSAAQSNAATALAQGTIMFISVGMGLSLLITAWAFYRITGGLFNPAVTLALWLIGAVRSVRAILLTIAQLAGGIAGAALVEGLTPRSTSDVGSTITTLSPGMTLVRGLFLEAFLTAMLVFVILMLAAEKHKATFLAPIGIGLTLFVCQLFGTLWTGCAMNPARALGPSVLSNRWPGYTWIYYVGPIIGSLIATFIYSLLKAFDYGSVVLGQDSDNEATSPRLPVASRMWHASMGFTRDQRKAMLASGMRPDELERAEAGMVANTAAGPMHGSSSGASHVSDATLGAQQHPAIHMDAGNNGNGPLMFPKKQEANGTSIGTTHLASPTHPAYHQQTSPLVTTTSPNTMYAPPAASVHEASARPGAQRMETSSMHPVMQAVGGIGAPGSHGNGLGMFDKFRKQVNH